MRHFIAAAAIFASLAPAAYAAEATAWEPGAVSACSGRLGIPSRIAYMPDDGGACCGHGPACARLLATTVIRRAPADLHL